jgi:hypothetical protein
MSYLRRFGDEELKRLSNEDKMNNLDIFHVDTITKLEPIISVEEFFNDDPSLPYQSLPPHSLEQSPCYPVIDKKHNNLYYCKLHPGVQNVNLETVEHHCKYKEPDAHKSEIIRLLSTKGRKEEVS